MLHEQADPRGQHGGDVSGWLCCWRKRLSRRTQSLVLMGKRICFNDVFDMKGHSAPVRSLQ